jgi:hypothetical protein
MPWFALAYALVSRVLAEVKWRSEVQKQRIQEDRGRSRERMRRLPSRKESAPCRRIGGRNLRVDKTERVSVP